MSVKKIHTAKLRLVAFAMLIVAIGAIGLAFRWQLIDNEEFIAIANERFKDIRIPALRGTVLAADGSTLAFSEPRFDVYVWLPELERAESRGFQSRDEFVSTTAEVLEVEEEDIEEILNSGPWWLKVASRIDVDTRNELEDVTLGDSNRKLQGLQFEYVNRRVYPEDQLASHIVGFVGSNATGETVGVGGIEQYWEGSLKPQEGFESGEFDSFGNPITIGDNEPLEPKPGVTIHTTIDKNLQSILEKQLKIGANTFEANSATGIIMDPKTGAILALANVPDYDPNNYFDEEDGTVFGNRAITIPYEIGSVAKVFTLAATIDLGTLEADTYVMPQGHYGCEIISPNPPADADCSEASDEYDCICTFNRAPVREPISVAEGFINSDNIALRHMALTMTYEEFHEYLERFGVGRSTGIELAGESTGLLKQSNKWNYADQAVFSYGHGFQITPLQAVSAIATVANEGKRMQPYIVSKVVDADGRTTVFNPQIVAEVIEPSTAQAVSDVMNEVYIRNLSEREYKELEDYYISMKSGTALIANKDSAGYSSEINATYVGFDASPEHTFVMLIKLEEPQVGDLSYYNARVVWLDTFKEIKDYLAVRKYSR